MNDQIHAPEKKETLKEKDAHFVLNAPFLEMERGVTPKKKTAGPTPPLSKPPPKSCCRQPRARVQSDHLPRWSCPASPFRGIREAPSAARRQMGSKRSRREAALCRRRSSFSRPRKREALPRLEASPPLRPE